MVFKVYENLKNFQNAKSVILLFMKIFGFSKLKNTQIFDIYRKMKEANSCVPPSFLERTGLIFLEIF